MHFVNGAAGGGRQLVHEADEPDSVRQDSEVLLWQQRLNITKLQPVGTVFSHSQYLGDFISR